jgi:hypothetical protein
MIRIVCESIDEKPRGYESHGVLDFIWSSISSRRHSRHALSGHAMRKN